VPLQTTAPAIDISPTLFLVSCRLAGCGFGFPVAVAAAEGLLFRHLCVIKQPLTPHPVQTALQIDTIEYRDLQIPLPAP
jgi:hypothetical protein